MITLLILCTGNSARSILGETVFNALGQGRVRAVSAGSQPKNAPHPRALNTLSAHGHSTEGLASKSWDVFAEPGAPRIDAVITVCDSAAAESCPIWPGAPAKAHWGLPDPAAIDDPSAASAAFEATYQALRQHVSAFMAALGEPGDEDLAAALKAGQTESGRT